MQKDTVQIDLKKLGFKPYSQMNMWSRAHQNSGGINKDTYRHTKTKYFLLNDYFFRKIE